MKVLKNNILIEEPDKVEKKSEGGIILQNEESFSSIGETKVVAVGEDVKNVKEGDTILYRVKAGLPFKHGDKTFRVFPSEEVIAVL